LDFGRWSNVGCKATSVSRKLDASGVPMNALGLVTCQCNHLTHFAVGFGETKVRFLQAPGSARSGDVYQVLSGGIVSFDVDIVDEIGAGSEVQVLSITPTGRSFSPPRFKEKGHGVYQFEWTPRDAGTYRIEIELMVDGELVDVRTVYVRVLFCEDFLLAGETLQDVAFRNGMPWQVLFAINPQIENPRMLQAEPQGRTWTCNEGMCSLTGQTPGTRVKIGRLYTVPRDQTLTDVVTSLGSSFTQLARHNMKRLEAVMDGTPVFDIAARHNVTTGTEISYVGEEFCVVSGLADGCLV